jgi:cyanophycin synthetase
MPIDMKIEKIQALRGPNIWSIRRKADTDELDLEEMENYPTNKIDGFREN